MMLRKTKIVCTIGPASDNYDTLKELMLNGMNVARVNFSHGTWEEQRNKVNLIKQLREELGLPISLLLDTKGPEIRLGKFVEKVYLTQGNTFILRNDDILGDETQSSISYKELYNDVKEGTIILIDDGLIKLEVIDINNKDIICKIINSGYISSNKSVNVPGIKLNLPSLTQKDIDDIEGAVENEMDYIAASFVRRKEDVLAIRQILDKYNSKIKIISKIENKEGIDNFDEILEVSDGIMVARGDLGVEIPFSQVPIVQKEMIKRTYAKSKTVITATQMMESMINEPNPTRAEVSDVANAIFDGTSAIMLSGETATGKYPVECVKRMVQIALDVEASIDYAKRFKIREVPKDNFEYIINHAMLTSALNIDVKAIFCYTKTSDTPRILASMRPKCPIFVSTSDKKIFNQLSLVWGLNVRLMKEEREPKTMILDHINSCVEEGKINKGDIVLIAGGKYIIDDEREVNKSIGGIYQV
ncbi:MAG: pyruvate kinase [Firmicutes bacterium]|nr:pyruvate kinase [Bacillota bacterium]